MKKLLTILPILILIVLDGISQTSSDSSVAIPISQLKKAISIIEVCKVERQELDLSRKAIVIAESRLNAKDSIIQLFITKEKTYLSIIDNYKKNLSNQDQIIANTEKMLTQERKKNKTAKTVGWLKGIGGFALALIIFK